MIKYEGQTFDTLEEAIAFIPGVDGWAKSHSEEIYVITAKHLVARGFTEVEALSLVDCLYLSASIDIEDAND